MTGVVNVPPTQAKARAKQPTISQQALTQALDAFELFHTKKDGPSEAWVSYERNGHMEHAAIRSMAGRQLLSAFSYKVLGKALSRKDADQVIDGLEAEATHNSPFMAVHTRLADLGHTIYIDLANEDWEVVEITKKGWCVIPGDQAPVRFRRPNGTEALPTPRTGGDLRDLQKFLNTDRAGFVLACSFLLGAFTDRGPQPVAFVNGEHGGAKSTATRVLQHAVDPRKAALSSAPKNDEDLAVICRNTWVVSLDNLSHMPPALSDGLCRVATGGSFTTRQQYTNGELFVSTFRQPVVFNSITQIVTRPDLADRTLPITVLPIDKAQRLTEAEFWADFRAAYPPIFGALLTALSCALSRLDTTRPDELPRLADFYRLVLAAEPAMPWEPGEFVTIFAAMTDSVNEDQLRNSPVGAALLKVLETRGSWLGSAAALLDTLRGDRGWHSGQPDSWPQGPRGMTGALQRLTPTLRCVGWHTQTGLTETARGHGRLVAIVRVEELTPLVAAYTAGGMSRVAAEERAALELASPKGRAKTPSAKQKYT